MARMLPDTLIMHMLQVPHPSESQGEELTCICMLPFYTMAACAVMSLQHSMT